MKKDKVQLYTSIASFMIMLALLYYGRLYMSAVFLAAGVIGFGMHLKAENSKKKSIDRDALIFAERFLKCGTKPVIERISASIQPNFAFYHDMEDAVEHYVFSGDVDRAFSNLIGSGSRCLSEVAATIVKMLETGADHSSELERIVERQRHIKELRMRNLGLMANSASITELGSMVFFPAFAGVCRNILMLTSSGNAQYYAYTFVIIAFVIVLAGINAIFKRSTFKEKAFGAFMFISVGIFVYFFVNSVSASALW